MPKNIRPIRIEGQVAYVPLTKGYEAVIDAADVSLVDGRNWQAFVSSSTVYAASKDHSNGKRKSVLMHRVIMGDPERFHVDHRDGNGLHNRRENLRHATRAQNNRNKRTPQNNTSGFKGVYWHKIARKWRAKIAFNGRSKHIGLYDTVEDAHAAYREASVKYHGEFGRTD
jgi:hypothetical protein